VCVAEQVRLVVFHFNVPPRRWVDELHASGARVWQQAASVDRAVAAADIGMDAIVAQGLQGGGHNKSTTRTMQLVRRVIRAVSPLMVLASGGIATGADVASALGNGADGVWIGTRLRSQPAEVAPEQATNRAENSTVTSSAPHGGRGRPRRGVMALAARE